MSLPENYTNSDFESEKSVFLFSSDLKKIKCSENLMEKSPFLKNIYECVVDTEKFRENNSNLIIYLDYHSEEFEKVLEFLENGEISNESVSVIQNLD